MEKILENFNKDDIKYFSSMINKLSPLEFISYGCIISIIITQVIDPNEQNTLGNFLEMIGQILLTSYAQSTVTNPKYINLSLFQGEQLQNQINILMDKLFNNTNIN